MNMRLACTCAVLAVLAAACGGQGGSGPGTDADQVNPAAISQRESDRVDPWWLKSVPGPDDRTLDLLVEEQDCASGQSADGLIASDVRYEEDAITVWVNVRERTEDRSCPGNPDTPYTIRLREPLGERKILDGNRTPPAPARTERPSDLPPS